ncbi:hypothetical protein Rhe02_69800 [Rhizocola hellebori]|uniref:Peptidase S9 prolyl oligopeptidase catalytic domain-containing protein n=1 Tax=Rhizocola hellebori TaxID=1392758 RepID=A0A8J3QDJ2_9ACTN|nr:hypothetical protein Rhe02_69800 [Rhizocola hellebori]
MLITTDHAPSGVASAVISTPAFPPLAECRPEAVRWRSLRVCPDLIGLVPTRARPVQIDIELAEQSERWTIPVVDVLANTLSWHPGRPVVAGLAFDGAKVTPWVADYQTRTVRRYTNIRAATSFTSQGGKGHPPLVWCAENQLALLIAASDCAPPSPAAAGPTWRPAVYEAIGPGYVTFEPEQRELALLAAARPAVYDLETSNITALGPPLLIRSLTLAPDGDALVIEHADSQGESPDANGLRWSSSQLDLVGTSRKPIAPAAAMTQPPKPAASGSAGLGTSRSVQADRGRARVDLLPADPANPLILWIRNAGSGQVPPATGCATAILDLTLDWPDDADPEMLRRQIVTAVRSALAIARNEYAASHNGTVVVGGHSFGATLALFALAHVAELAGAIAHSGCYNRTLTPTGFQHEKRDYWRVPTIYHAFSALHFADRLDRPVLIVHGAADLNPATTPDQAVDLYRCIVATGGRARLVLLPHEGHTFRYREVCQALAVEHQSWLSQWR